MRRPILILVPALLIAGCADDASRRGPTEASAPASQQSIAEEPASPDVQAIEHAEIDLYQVAYHKYWAGREKEAFELMLALAERGDPRAEFWMGSRYLRGDVFNNDDAKAVMWIRRSAEHGYALAQLNLGIMYRDGRRGLTRDTEEATKWFALAAAQGDPSAKAALIELDRAAAY